jgi:two-component system KDP operon response regulator KdpE
MTSVEVGRPLCIIVVEDEATNRELLRAVLARSRDPRLTTADVVEAASLTAGRRALDECTPDLIILDVRLPDGSGLDLARELKQLGKAETLRVIAMSASVLPPDRAAALEAGCDVFLPKPFQPSELVATIQRLLAPSTQPEAPVAGASG